MKQRKNVLETVVEKPAEDKWFEVKPQAIKKKIFKRKMVDTKQERVRLIILEAFAEMKKNPQKYKKSFKTMMPKKTWTSLSVAELKEMARIEGGHNADWVEQALEWAQRLTNGESWQELCNEPDTANCYRLVVGKNGHVVLIGGSITSPSGNPATKVTTGNYKDWDTLSYTVPLVVSKDS